MRDTPTYSSPQPVDNSVGKGVGDGGQLVGSRCHSLWNLSGESVSNRLLRTGDRELTLAPDGPVPASLPTWAVPLGCAKMCCASPLSKCDAASAVGGPCPRTGMASASSC